MDNDDYLKEGFDAQTLNMSSIRGLLVKHSVEYPANAKKPQLVGLLHEHVLSKASKLRKEARKQRRAKADGRDIEQVGASGGGSGAAAGKAIGSRTRSQTPRTERTRAPQFGAKPGAKSEEPKSGSKSEPKPGAEAPAAKPSSSSKKERLDKEARSEKEQRLDRKDKSDKKLKKPKIKKHKREEQTATAAGSTSPARAVGKASSVKRTTAKRKLSDAEGDVSADSGDDRMFTPQRVRVKQRPKKQHGGGGGEAVAEANFSDENPFQSSPEVARKRRRKAEAERTPMSALRKSQPSGVSFRVALPQKDEQSNEEEEEEDVVMDEEPPKPLFAVTEDASDEAMDEYEEEENQGSDGRARVSELVARYQQQQQQPRDARPRSPTVRIRDGLQPAAETPKPVAETPKPAVEASKPEPRLPKPRSEIPKPRSELPKPIVEVTRPITGDRLEQPKRFTMTPDALRELAAQQQQQHAEPSRRRTMATSGLPPVAPGIPVTRTDKHVGRERLAGEPAAEPPISSPSFEPTFEPSFEQAAREAHELQRRRVATLRQHVESAAAAAAPASDARTHSRRSSIASIASSVGEARGIPATPAAPEPKHTKQHGSWAVRLVWAAAIGAAALAWRTHEQFAVGFGSARAEYAALAPPRDSILAVPEPPADDAPFPLHAAYYARAARAWMAPVPLECPEHADCVPYTPIPAHAAHAGAALSSAARDQWIVASGGQRVAVVQCDAGHVLQFPLLSSRVYPMAPACVRDVPTEHRVRQLVAAMQRECRVHRGRAQCEMTLMEQARELRSAGDEDEADAVERLGVSAHELHAAMARRKAPRLSDAEFDTLFRLAAAELDAGDAVSAYALSYEDEDEETTFYVARDAEYPPFCHVQRLALRAIVGHVPALLAVVGAGVLAFVGSRRFAAFRAESRAADALVGSALERLQRQARRHYMDPALSPSPAIPSLQLRDLLLLASGTPPGSTTDVTQAYFDPRARSSVWERVRRVVERNANVRCRTTAVRGEPMRVWEWIGPLDNDDDELMSPFASPQRV